MQSRMDNIISNTNLSEVQSVYPADHESHLQALRSEDNSLPTSEDSGFINIDEPLKPVKLQSIEEELNETDIDSTRIIEPGVNISTLYEFVPATKIKGRFNCLFLLNRKRLVYYVYVDQLCRYERLGFGI